MTNTLPRFRCKCPRQCETAVGLHVECLLQHNRIWAIKYMPIIGYITQSLERLADVLWLMEHG
jgi:hypothetical protein